MVAREGFVYKEKALSVTQSTVRHTKCGRMRGMVVGEVQLMLLALRVEGVGGGPISRKKKRYVTLEIEWPLRIVSPNP